VILATSRVAFFTSDCQDHASKKESKYGHPSGKHYKFTLYGVPGVIVHASCHWKITHHAGICVMLVV